MASCNEAGVLPFEFIVAKSVADRAINFIEKTYGGNEEVFLLTEAENLLQKYANETLPSLVGLHEVGDRR